MLKTRSQTTAKFFLLCGQFDPQIFRLARLSYPAAELRNLLEAAHRMCMENLRESHEPAMLRRVAVLTTP
jgi:hypothetical protein